MDEHHALRRDLPNMLSQLSFVLNPKGVRCLLYQDDSITKTHDGGLKDMQRERKVVWVYPNLSNVSRCLVRLVDKYLSLCPKFHKKPNFYLKSLTKPHPKQWYSAQVIGRNKIGSVVKTLMKDAGIEGFFTNHSTRCTGSTQLFRAGVDRKLVKEVTGHMSDVVDKYQITSDDQHQMLSEIIARNANEKIGTECEERLDNSGELGENAMVKMSQSDGLNSYNCNKTALKVNDVWTLVSEIMQ